MTRDEILKLLRDAYSEGFNEGTREHTTYSGGKLWSESGTFKRFVNAGRFLCKNCQDQIDDSDKDFCGTCREMRNSLGEADIEDASACSVPTHKQGDPLKC